MNRVITLQSNDLDKSIKIKEELKEKLKKMNFKVSEDLQEDTELIVSIGGDGSFLKTVNKFDFSNKLFVGINTGHLGFFTDVSVDEIDEFLEFYMKKEYVEQDVYILKSTITTKDGDIDILAMNEIVIKCDESKVIHADLNVDANKVQKISGDGLIISTPLGSTAYNYSARGSIVDPNLNMIQVTPLNPLNTGVYRSFTSSTLFSGKSILEVIPEYKFKKSMLIVVDGIEYKFDKVSMIKSQMTNQKIKLIRMPNYNFWTRVSSKFL